MSLQREVDNCQEGILMLSLPEAVVTVVEEEAQAHTRTPLYTHQ